MSALLESVKWRSRRGLLELDLVFTRFYAARQESLQQADLEELQDLLVCDDHELWAMLNGSKQCDNPHWKRMVAMIRETFVISDSANECQQEG